MAGFVGAASAVSRRFENVKIEGLAWTRKVDAATCEDGKAPLIEVHHYVDGCCFGRLHVRRAKLAVADDEALIVRFDDYSCWICLSKTRKRIYVRFPAARNTEAVQAPDR